METAMGSGVVLKAKGAGFGRSCELTKIVNSQGIKSIVQPLNINLNFLTAHSKYSTKVSSSDQKGFSRTLITLLFSTIITEYFPTFLQIRKMFSVIDVAKVLDMKLH